MLFRSDVYDPYADPDEVHEEYGIKIISDESKLGKYRAIVAAVPHDSFKKMNLKKLMKKDCVMYDVKNILPDADGAL